jgi:hypothetical protein
VVSFELLLPIGAITFYLLDSAALLYGNEFIFTLRSEQWAWSAGSDVILRGRRLYLPNPLTPQLLTIRTAWSEQQLGDRAENSANIATLQQTLRPVAILSQLLLFMVVIALPAVIALLGTGAALLAVFGLCYLSALTMIGLLYRRRARLSISNRQFVGLALDSLLCPPFAINLVRKIGLRQNLVADPAVFANENFLPEQASTLINAICKRLEQDMSGLDQAEAKWIQLQAYRERLMSLSK